MDKNCCINEVSVAGEVVTPIEKSYTRKGIDFYKFYISIERNSGVKDIIPVIVSSKTLEMVGEEIKKEDFVSITGQYRSYSRAKKLELNVYALEISKFIQIVPQEEPEYDNYINLVGYICKKNPVRITPMGRRVMDIILAVNRFNKSSYIPCIVWNLSDEEADKINVGDKAQIIGRIQSRQYNKKYEDETSEIKTAYEVSVRDLILG